MWSNRSNFPIRRLPDCKLSACVETPRFLQQQLDSAEREDLYLDVDDFNYLSCLGYTLVPGLSRKDAQTLLTWVLHRWLPGKHHPLPEVRHSSVPEHALNCVVEDQETVSAFTQVEYFFTGTDNGHLFAVPLLPMHFLRVLVERHGPQFPGLSSELKSASQQQSQNRVPVHCCARRLLHRHAREELVMAVDHNGTIVASASSDGAVAMSFFHPSPAPIVCISHPKAVRCLKLWEGSVFVDRMVTSDNSGASNAVDSEAGRSAREAWRHALCEQERAALYVFTGDAAATVRLWRVDVVKRQHALLHVFVASPSRTGLHSPLDVLGREDVSKHSTMRETATPIYCLALDGDSRLLAGTDGGFFAWSIDKLSWKPMRGGGSGAAQGDASQGMLSIHPLCWSESTCTPFVPFLLEEPPHSARPVSKRKGQDDNQLAGSKDDHTRALQTVRSRASRLVNHHVWLCEADYMRQFLRVSDHDYQGGKGRALSLKKGTDLVACRSGTHLSKWKPKYDTRVAGGAAVGVVCNEVALQSDSETNAAVESMTSLLLRNSVVTVRFNEGGELSSDLSVPLCCVEPVAYPLCFMKTPRVECFALVVLQEDNRIVTSGSDGKCVVWVWKPEIEVYVPMLGSDNKGGGAPRHLGRHLCRLRKSDIFVSCGQDDSLVKEWHVYDEPELLFRCERRFTIQKDSEGVQEMDGRDCGQQGNERVPFSEGISCALSFEPFGALFLVGIFESTIRSFSILEVSTCEAPPDFIYDGHKTVRVPEVVREAFSRQTN